METLTDKPNLSFMTTFLSTGSFADIQKQQKIQNYNFASCCICMQNVARNLDENRTLRKIFGPKGRKNRIKKHMRSFMICIPHHILLG
jgi:hypothetical protein